MYFKNSRIRDLKYLQFVSTLPCIISGTKSEDVIGHHLLRGVERGTGLKSPDNCVIPMSFRMHNALHANGNETEFLSKHGITDAPKLAKELYKLYKEKDYEGCYTLVKR